MKSLLYVCEQWPNPYKPTWDFQIQSMIDLGFKVSVVQCGSESPQYSPSMKKHLESGTVTRHNYPATLKDLPRQFLNPLFILNIILRVALLATVFRQTKSLKDKVMDYLRLCSLPGLKYDYVLVKNLNCAADYVTLPAIVSSRTAPTVYYHGGAVEGVPALYMTQRESIFANYGLLFTNTRYSKRELESLGAPSAKVHAVPVGLNIEEKEQQTKIYRRDGVLSILSSCRLSAEKGVIYAIKAVESLVHSGVTNIKYDIVGNGSEEQSLRKYVEENGLGQWVEFHGRQPNDRVNSVFMANADVLLNTCYPTKTWAETQCVAIQEAGLALVPSIASNCGGLPEVITNGETGLLVETKSIASIAEAIKYLAQVDTAKLENMGRAAEQLVREKFDVNIVTKTMVDIIASEERPARHDVKVESARAVSTVS